MLLGRCAFLRFCATWCSNSVAHGTSLSSLHSFNLLTQLAPFFEINSTVFWASDLAACEEASTTWILLGLPVVPGQAGGGSFHSIKKHKPIRTLKPIEQNHPPALSLTCLLLWSRQRMCWIAIPLTPSKYSVKCVLSLDLHCAFYTATLTNEISVAARYTSWWNQFFLV